MEAALLSGFIKSILPRFFSLMQEKYKLQTGLKDDIKFLEKELRMIAVTIDDQISLGREDHGAVLSLSMEEMRELAQQIEDCVDRFTYQVAREQQVSSIRRTARSLKTMLSRQRLAAEVQRLKKVPEEAHQRMERYRVFCGHSSPSPSSSSRYAESSSSLSDPHTLKADLVGIDAPRDEVVEQLADGEPKQLKVISIVGFRGSGKTVLAREVYESDVGRQFSLRAWVSATDRSPGEVLMDIAHKLSTPVPDTSDVHQLTVDLREYLGKKRYLIVIDDMQTDQWSIIEAAFPGDNGISSRVMVTTTIQSVANACSSPDGYVHKMKRLGGKHSEQLFYKKACPKEYLGYIRPESRQVLKKCDGQPLALVSMGQFLRKKGWPTGPTCEDVCRHLSHHLEKDETLQRMRRVLLQTFSSLPGHGPRACLLYFGMFPCDHPIGRKSLMRRWLAEGFVETQPSSSENFDILIDRNIIDPIGVGDNDQVKTCRIYGMMHEFILHMSTSQNFITLFPDYKVEFKCVRRLSLYRSGATSGTNLNIDLSLVRSLMVFGDAGKAILNFQKYQLLRVLDLEQCTDLEDDHLKNICNLLLLKYLSLGKTVTSLPKEIEKLKLLETLDLRRTRLEILPVEVLLLPCLLHLFGKFHLSKKIKITNAMQKFFLTGQSTLETLSGFVDDGSHGFPQIMSYMTNLRKVKIWFERAERSTKSTDLDNAIQNFIHDDKEECNDPRSLSLHFNDFSEDILNILKAPCYLRSLKLQGKLLELPKFVISMRGLRELCLSSAKLTAALLSALTKLTDLQHLKLIANELEEFVIKEHTFPGLLHLCIILQSSTTLPIIEEGSLPYLISLKIICKDLDGLANIKINFLRCLKVVTLDSRVKQETVATWEKAAKEHPNRPQLLFFNPDDERDSEEPDGCFSTISPEIEVMQTSKSERVAQEDDIQMPVNHGSSVTPMKENKYVVESGSKDKMNSPLNNVGFSKIQLAFN